MKIRKLRTQKINDIGSCTINVCRSIINDSMSINYKNIIIVRMKIQLGASLTDDFRSVIYYCNMFIIQATECYISVINERKQKEKQNFSA